jgi:hypothetical protein
VPEALRTGILAEALRTGILPEALRTGILPEALRGVGAHVGNARRDH